MLSATEIEQITHELQQVPVKKAACIEALKIVQRQRRWISDESVADIAGILEMSPAEVHSLATFYNLILRQTVDNPVILLCDSISCWLTGYDGVRRHLCRRLGVELGGTTADGRFTLLPSVCLGRCERAPVMLIGEDVHGELTAQAADDILEHYR